MTSRAPALSRHALEAKIVKRCWENDAFRKEFIGDPAACFVKYLNASQAQLPKIVVHEEQLGTWHIVLHAKPGKAGELSDEELEKVAGGTDLIVTVVATAGMGLGASLISAGAILSAAGGW
jgi:hypothetical protein